MVTALDQSSDRVRGLEAGADDFLTKPIPELALIARVRSLTRLKMVTDELRMRALTSRDIGIELPEREAVADTGRNGRVLIVDDRPASYERIASMLSKEHSVDIEPDPNEALFRASDGNYDLLIISLGLENFDGLRLCSQLRSLDRTRNVPILAITEPDNSTRMLRGLEIGVNDYLMRPIDKNELLARARTQVRKRRYTERLRDNVQISIEMAITDALTGLFNRRYMENHLGTLVEQAVARGKPLAVLALDIDHFKSINDTHGHDAGDDVLRDFALRIKRSIRGIDLATPLAAARSSLSSCRKPIWRWPQALPNGCAGVSRPSRLPSVRARARFRSRSRSASRRCAGGTIRPPACSSAQTRRSIAPSAMAGTGLSRTPRKVRQSEFLLAWRATRSVKDFCDLEQAAENSDHFAD